MKIDITPKHRVVDYIMHQPNASLVALGIKLSLNTKMNAPSTEDVYRIVASPEFSLQTKRKFDVYRSVFKRKGISKASDLPEGHLGYMKFKNVVRKKGENGKPDYFMCYVVLTDEFGEPIKR
jgi:hypothetical protein